MREKAMEGSGEEQHEAHIEISAEAGGSTPGMRAVECISELMDEIKDKNTQLDIIEHYYMIYGFVSCCLQCGFITEENADELMNMVKKMSDDEFEKMQGRNLLL